MKRLAILGYHKIGSPPANGWKTWFFVSEAVFLQQINDLQSAGWTVIDLETFLTGLDRSETLPYRAALVSFDDGYRTMRTVGLGLLQKLGIPAVLFVPSDYIGKTNRFDCGIEPDEPICDWNDLKELGRSGISIQSHAASHKHFSRMNLDEQCDEVRRSKEVIENGMGKAVQAIAFPYGDDGRQPEALRHRLQETGYRAGFRFRGGTVSVPIDNPYRLTRLAMGPGTQMTEALGR